jgi:hypothetical protein
VKSIREYSEKSLQWVQTRFLPRSFELWSDAVLRLTWCGGGTLEGPGVRAYRWSNTNSWRSEWSFADSSGRPLASLTPKFAGLKHAGEVRVTPQGREARDFDLLVLLGWFMLLLISDDSAAIFATSV